MSKVVIAIAATVFVGLLLFKMQVVGKCADCSQCEPPSACAPCVREEYLVSPAAMTSIIAAAATGVVNNGKGLVAAVPAATPATVAAAVVAPTANVRGPVAAADPGKKVILMPKSGVIFDDPKDFVKASTHANHLYRVSCLCNKQPMGDFTKPGYKITCVDVVRPPPSECIVYSVGDLSFNFAYEQALLARFPHCKVYVIGQNIVNAPSSIIVHNAKIGKCSDGCKSVEAVIAELGHSGKTIDIFKANFDGAEVDMFDQIFNPHFAQVQLQVHNMPVAKAMELDNTLSKNWCLADIAPYLPNWAFLELLFVNKQFAFCDSSIM